MVDPMWLTPRRPYPRQAAGANQTTRQIAVFPVHSIVLGLFTPAASP
jgi:hypothetical protein